MMVVLQFLCLAVSATCAVMLLRQWARTRLRMLLFSGLGFSGIALNNLIVVIETAMQADYSAWRGAPTLAGLVVLIWGLTGERER